MIHTLLLPYYYSVKNRLFEEVNWRSHTSRDIVLAAFAACIMIGIYSGSHWVLEKIGEFSRFGYLPASHILSLILMTLFFMLLASCVAIAFGTLFLAQDLDLILSSPVTAKDFFFGKFLSVLCGSSWMPVVFISPLILAFGEHLSAPLSFYLFSVLSILPYFVIPSAIALSVAIFFVTIIPSNRNREALFAVIAAFLYGVYALVQFIKNIDAGVGGASEVLRIISILSAHSISWIPSNWVASFLSAWLEPETQRLNWNYLSLLYFVAISCVTFSYLSVSIMHFYAYTKSQNTKLVVKIKSQFLRHALNRLLPFIGRPLRAMIEKELKTLSRDISQIVQVIMLVTICVVYLYNLKILAAFESMPIGDKIWWQNFLYGSNICIGAFITTAISTRFIFPSISLEGRGFWVVQNSPLTLRQILKAKFICWFPPVTIVSCVIFGVGAYAIKASVAALVCNMLASVFISCGIVGMAIGFGAVFANFSWEHSYQLAAGLGNFLFMLASTALIFFDTALVAIGLAFWRDAVVRHNPMALIAIVVITLTLLLLNIVTAKWSIRVGERSLERVME